MNIATPSCSTVDSPVGPLHLSSNGSALTGLLIEGSVSRRDDGHTCSAHPDRIIRSATKQLDQYFAKKRTVFDVPVACEGTDFQEAVWSSLGDIPWGETTTYGELGTRAGRPGAPRAVGGCLGRNPIAIIVPCHRVLGSARRVTGYSAGEGVSTKRWLLAHEGISYRD